MVPQSLKCIQHLLLLLTRFFSLEPCLKLKIINVLLVSVQHLRLAGSLFCFFPEKLLLDFLPSLGRKIAWLVHYLNYNSQFPLRDIYISSNFIILAPKVIIICVVLLSPSWENLIWYEMNCWAEVLFFFSVITVEIGVNCSYMITLCCQGTVKVLDRSQSSRVLRCYVVFNSLLVLYCVCVCLISSSKFVS